MHHDEAQQISKLIQQCDGFEWDQEKFREELEETSR